MLTAQDLPRLIGLSSAEDMDLDQRDWHRNGSDYAENLKGATANL